jgi:hypothetical protein
MSEVIESESFYKPEAKGKDKISPVPNLETPAAAQKRAEPFVMSDWSGSNAYKATKP